MPGEATEQDLIDSPWMQRLRRVPQLQSARWVFPAAEHSRFQHSLGRDAPGRPLRPAAPPLAQGRVPRRAVGARSSRSCCAWRGCSTTSGHGPFGHFFDDNFLVDFDLTHEIARPAHHPRGARRPDPRAPAQPVGAVRDRRAHRPRVDLLPDGQELHAARRAEHPRWLAASQAAALGHLHRRQHGLRAARLLHVRGGGGADRHRADHLLLVLQRQGAHARPRRHPGLHHVPERALLHVHQRLLPPDHARHRPAPQGDLPRHHAAHRSPTTSTRSSSRIST